VKKKKLLKKSYQKLTSNTVLLIVIYLETINLEINHKSSMASIKIKEGVLWYLKFLEFKDVKNERIE
jgi:hypothetical protein